MQFVIVILVFLKISLTIASKHHIDKRTLLFPEFTLYQFTYGLAIPAELPNRSIKLNGCIQNNFNLPFNVSQFNPVISAKAKDNYDYDLDRNTFYKYVIGILDGLGLDGESCLLRSICEVADIPMHIEESNSLLESIMHFLLTPSEDYFSTTNISHSLDDHFLDAENIGKTKGKCEEEFVECPFSLVDLFTKLFHV